MSRKVNVMELMRKVRSLTGKIDEIIRISGYDYDSDFELDYDRDNPDEVQLYHELRFMVEKLDDVRSEVYFLDREIDEVSELHKNMGGRYVTASGKELTCGTGIEFLYKDTHYEDRPLRWISARIEHNGEDYYIFGYPNVDLGTAVIRLRKFR